MKKYVLASISLFTLIILISFTGDEQFFASQNLPSPEDSIITINFSCVGDLMCHSPQFQYAAVAEDSFDFEPVFREVKKYFASSDVVFGNFETVLGGKEKQYSGFPFFNSPDDYLTSLKHVGFDYLNTANNHSLDQKEAGLIRTIDEMINHGINYFGTYTTQMDRDSIRIFQKGDFRIAFLGYSYGTNGLPVPKNKDYLINLIKPELIIKDIQSAKNLNPDLIIVYYHFGEEYQKEPNTYQEEIAKLAKDAGADIIIASHPHVLQPIELFTKPNSKLDTGFIAYSLGNFISNQQWRYSDAGVILNFTMEKNKNDGKISLKNLNCVPTYVYKGAIEGKKEYLILPSGNYADSVYTFLTKTIRSKMKEAFIDSKGILTNRSNIQIISN